MASSVVFFGSSPFSVIVLQQLLDNNIPVSAVVTFPDKPMGRHLTLTPNPVKLLAQQNHIKIVTDLNTLDLTPYPSAIGLVAAYGKIIPQNILDTFSDQFFNIHPSLLPKYRGPSPLQQQILDGVSETGVTIIQLDAKMDHGPIVAQEKVKILASDTTQTLGTRLFSQGANLFINEILSKIKNLKFIIQKDSQATYTHLLTRQSGFIPWIEFENLLKIKNCELKISRMLRAYVGWPGVWSITPEGKRIKLISITPPLVQLEGKKPTSCS